MTYHDIGALQNCQFLVDCSVLPAVIRAAQEFGSNLVHEHLFPSPALGVIVSIEIG
jgi:hypothetical protein